MAQHRLIVSVVAAFSCSVGADVVFVDDNNCPGPGSGTELDPFCSIQTAIDNAVDTDEIVVAPGTYFETIDFLGKAITLRSSDGSEVTTIDGTGFFHVVRCVTGEGPDTVLDGFTITGGNASTGGGMFNEQSSPTVTDCVFSGNSANRGGGMYNDEGIPTVTGCTFGGNGAVRGGGMFNSFSFTAVTNCTFSGNSAEVGGGMFNDGGSPTVTNCTFCGNSSVEGGGMENVGGSATVTNCTFDGNTTAGGGGGMANGGSSVTVASCTFSGNSAGGGLGGGGMANGGGSPTVTNCVFSQNSAVAGGGMVNGFNSSPTVTNCSFIGNTAAINGGGMGNFSPTSPTVTNCILWGDSPNEIFGPATVVYSDVQGGLPGTGNIDANPLFVDPANGDYRLSPGSPCIDAADNTAVPKGVTTDLDGNPRFVDDPDTADCPQAPGTCGDPPVVDMGAYEFQTVAACPWDCGGDDDGNVGITDFLALLAQWGGPGACDFDGSGVGIDDFLELLANWGPCL